MIKMFFVLMLMFACVASAQNIGFTQLDSKAASQLADPPEYNLWAGSSLSYSIVGDPESFNTSIGLAGKFVINWFDFDSERFHFIVYGSLAPPISARNLSAANAINSAADGIMLGVQPYYIYGDIGKSWITGVTSVSVKNNNFGDGFSVWTYRFSGGFDGSISALNVGDMPLNLSATASYIIATDSEKFFAVQNDLSNDNYWLFEAGFILPIASKVGLAVQGDFSPDLAPVFRAGVLVSAGLF